MDARDPEDGEDRIADELLDRAAVSFDRGPHLVEVPVEDQAQGLGVQPLAQLGGVDQIAEQHGHGLARVANPLVTECRTARLAEA